jgi:N6-adenosine-specific RNA methylase IME4
MAWVKNKIGTGYYFRGQHELLLVGIKGKMSPPTEENRPPSVLMSPVEGHSKKPDIVYELIEKMYPNCVYLEVFANPNVKRNRWVHWGLSR